MNMIKKIIVILIALLPAACTSSSLVGVAPAAPYVKASYPLLVQAPANSTATATPFMPLPPTPSYLPTHFPTTTPTPTRTPSPSATPSLLVKTWVDYPAPSLPADIDIPAPVGLLPQPAGQINILLLGSDVRPVDGSFRTDTILLLTLNPTLGTANITSFPRDLYVYLPGWTVDRINTAQERGDFQLTQMTFEYNFGVHPDHYVLINFASFKEVVDSLGGIDVDVETPLTDQRDGMGYYTVSTGTHHMDGELALWYVRARYSTSDFARGHRQQEVIMAIFKKMLSLDAFTKIPKLFDIYRQNVTTDLSVGDLTGLIPLATKLTDTSRIHHYFISPQDVIPWRNTNGAQILIPIRDAVLAVMNQALNIN
ncbi:MAG: LCP family protein [Omnitrophica WOR_2 bacterium]